MGEGYYGVSDEFIMFVLVPALMLVIGYPLSKWSKRYE
jgi:hypothetical protein